MTTIDPDLAFILHCVQRESGLRGDAASADVAVARLRHVLRRENMASLGELARRLHQPSDGLLRRVVESLANSETVFFRDWHPFDALADRVLPELLARRGRETVVVWSAACASGQEGYSVAMLVRERFAGAEAARVRILATDLSREMLARSREGRYTQLEINRGLPASMLVKYFQRDGLDWRVREELRRMIEFRETNLMGDWAGVPSADVVLLRNVMIYFDVETKRAVLAKVRRVLRPGGYLFLGAAETTLGVDDAFDREVFGRAVYYRPRAGGPS